MAAPVTTIAWRLSHLTEMLAMRADRDDRQPLPAPRPPLSSGNAAEAIAGPSRAVAAWREVLLGPDDAALDEVGRSTHPHGSDADEPFVDVVWWVDQEVLHHGAEVALLRDLHRDLHRARRG